MINRKQAENISAGQRNSIRKSDKSDRALAREWGVKVATIALIRGGAPKKRGRKAAAPKAKARVTLRGGGHDGLHVEGGPDLPQPEG